MPNQSYTSNHRVKYSVEKVPVTGGVAEVDYEIAFTYEYSASDRVTPSYGDVNVDSAAVVSILVFPGGGGLRRVRKSAPEVSHEKISQELDALLGSGPLPDVDEWSNEPIPGNERQKKDAIDHFWFQIDGSEELREHLFASR